MPTLKLLRIGPPRVAARAEFAVMLAGVVALGAPVPRTALAQTASEIAARRELLNQARQAELGGDHRRAADFAQRALAVQSSVSVRRYLAEQRSAGGEFVAALGAAELCATEARREPSAAAASHLRACEQMLAQLQPRVGRVVVRVAERPPGLRVWVAGEELNAALYGVPYVVTPGAVVVEARAEGHTPYRVETSVGPQTEIVVDVRLAPESFPHELDAPAAPSPGGTVRVLVQGRGGSAVHDARVTCDGRVLEGDPPTAQGVGPGEHLVRVTAPSFEPAAQLVSVAPGHARVVTLVLNQSEPAGTLRVVGPVAGAQVLVDNVLVGTTPFARERLRAGRYYVEVRAPGFVTHRREVHVEDGASITVDAGLAEAAARVRLVGPSAPAVAQYVVGIDVGVGVGLAWLAGRTNTNPTTWSQPTPPLFILGPDGQPLRDSAGRVTNAPIRSDLSYAEFDRNTGACAPAPASSRPVAPLCPESVAPGFAPAGFVYFSARFAPARYSSGERVALGINGRYQWDHSGTGTLSMLSVGARLFLTLTPHGWRREGPVLAFLLGGGVGQMQARVPPPQGYPEGTQTGHIISGLGNANVGLHFEYGFASVLHAGVTVIANVQAPVFLFVLDLQSFVGLHF